MKQKIWVVLFVLAVSVLGLYGCSQDLDVSNQNNEHNGIIETSTTRKIIYNGTVSIYDKDVSVVHQAIKDSLNADEWVQTETFEEDFSRMVIRIKSDRLDLFITNLKETYDVRDYQKNATDISIEYYDNQARILTLEAEQARLIEMYDQSSISDMLLINRRISEIETELQELNGLINQYDSLIDYSELTIRISSTRTFMSTSFSTRLGNAFFGGLNALWSLLQLMLMGLLALLPFIVVFGPLGYGVYRLNRYLTNRKKGPKA